MCCNGEPFGEGFSGRLIQGVDGGRRGRSDADSDRGGSSGRGGDEGGEDDGDDCNSDRGDQLSGLVRAKVDEGIIAPRRSPSPRGSRAPCSCSCPCPCLWSKEEGLGWSSSSGPDSGGPMISVTTRARSIL